jgi:hypothetical protein
MSKARAKHQIGRIVLKKCGFLTRILSRTAVAVVLSKQQIGGYGEELTF